MPPLMGVFCRGLNRQLQDTLALQGCQKDLNSLISLATELDNYLSEQRREPAVATTATFSPTSSLSRLIPLVRTQPSASVLPASSSGN